MSLIASLWSLSSRSQRVLGIDYNIQRDLKILISPRQRDRQMYE